MFFLLLPLHSLALFSTTLLFLFTIVKLWKKWKSYDPALKLPPGPWKLPLIGNLHHLIGISDLYHRTFTDLAKKHGPIMHLQLGKLSVVVISSPEISEEVLKVQELNFAQRFQLLDAESIPYPDSSLIFAPYNYYWKQIRKISMRDLFSAKRIQSLRSVREEEVWNLVESVASSSRENSPINLSDNFCLLINNIVTRSVLGNKSDYLEDFKSSLGDVISSTKSFGMDDLFPFLQFLVFITGDVKNK